MCSTVLRVLATLLSLNWALFIGVWLWTICFWYSRDTMSEKKGKAVLHGKENKLKKELKCISPRIVLFFVLFQCFLEALSLLFLFFSDYLRADVKYRGNIHWTSLLWQNIEIWREINLFFVFKDGESYRKFVKLAIATTIDYVIFPCHNSCFPPPP